MPLISPEMCQLIFGRSSHITPDMLCAGDLQDFKTVCEVRPTAGARGQAQASPMSCLPVGGKVVSDGLTHARHKSHLLGGNMRVAHEHTGHTVLVQHGFQDQL